MAPRQAPLQVAATEHHLPEEQATHLQEVTVDPHLPVVDTVDHP